MKSFGRILMFITLLAIPLSIEGCAPGGSPPDGTDRTYLEDERREQREQKEKAYKKARESEQSQR